MRTDELRRELQQLADEIEPFEPDALAVHRTVRRRHGMLTAVAAVLVIVVAASVIALSRGGGGEPAIASSKKEYPAAAMNRLDVIVIPASPEVQRVLEHSPLVARYTPLPQGSVPPQFKALGSQALSDAACALQSASGYLVQSSQPGRDIGPTLKREIGKKAKVYDISEGASSDFEIFMKTDATEDEIAAIRDELATTAGIRSTQFLNHQDAFAEFQRIFKDQPALVQQTAPDALPESFKVVLNDGVSSRNLKAAFKARPGVDTVVDRSPTVMFAFSKLGQALMPGAQGEVFMKASASQPQIEAVRKQLARDDAVTSVQYLDHEAALTEFQKLFATQPALLKNTKASDLPPSFRVTLKQGTDADRWAEMYRIRGDVEEVNTADPNIYQPCTRTP